MTRLEARGVGKSYGAARVLDDVALDVRAGEIHALVGENGAGKSTLIKILGGAVRPDRGDVRLEGRPLPIGDPREARRRGVSIVYQEFTLIPELTVAENIFLGRETGQPLLDRTGMIRAAQAVLDDLGVRVAATARVRGLSVAHQQMVEIARALSIDAKVLILDEPSATLTGAEIDALFRVLRRLRERGLGIIYISHRLEEIFAIADRVTVLRDGRVVATTAAADTSRADLIRWMVGRDVTEEFPARTPAPGAVRLQVTHLAAPPRFHDVSFDVRAGEIVALAGLVGAGRSSAALAIAGAIDCTGDVLLSGTRVRFRSPAEAIAHGLAYVTEDRKARGVFPHLGTGENITVTHVGSFARFGILRPRRERASAAEAARTFDVRASSLQQPAGTLSGGNQQKLLLARFLLSPPAVLILDEPTRGVDVGARAEIYTFMNRLTDSGMGVLMISSDLPEVLGMADRIVVLREGRTVGELSRRGATAERMMAMATGTA